MKNIFILLVIVSFGLRSASQGSFIINSGAAIKTSNHAFIVLNNMNLINNGTYVQDTGNGTTKITGHINATASGTGTTTLDELELAVNNGVTYTLGSVFSIKHVLTLTSGQLAADGYLVLKSDSIYTARVAPVASTASPVVSGNVVAERFVWGRRKYRLICSSVTSSTSATLNAGQEALSIWGNWQNSGNIITPNNGTLITGGSITDGFDQGTSNASLYTYDDVNRVFKGYTTANGKNTKYTPLKAGIAYLMFVYGDRRNSVFATNPNNTVLHAKGILKTGDQTYNTGSAIPLAGVTGKFTLLGNPFASPINWATIPKTNLENSYWGWDPNLSSTGGYITVTTLGEVTIQAPYSGSTGLNQYIQSGQGFFVKTTGAAPELIIREEDKVSNYNPNAYRTGFQPNAIPLMAVNLHYMNNGNKILADGVLAVFDSSFSNNIAAEDAGKMANTAETLSILNGTTALSIDGRKIPQSNDTLFLNIARFTKPQYSLQIFTENLENSNVLAFLRDNYLNTTQPLSLTDTNNITVNINTGIPASFDINRFRIVFTSTVVVLPVKFISVKAAQKNKDILVDWVVAEESGIMKYVIERSADGSQFAAIGEATAKGNSNSSESYTWLDAQPLPGNNYYRIRAIQADGRFIISTVVFVKMAGINIPGTVCTVFPNPVTGHQVNLRVTNLAKGKFILQLFSQQGRQVYQLPVTHIGSTLNMQILLNKNIAHGIYYLKLTGENLKFTETIIIGN